MRPNLPRAVQKKVLKNQKLKVDLIELYGSKCYYCETNLPYNRLTIDHIYPQSKGGSQFSFGNTILSCFPCNRRKGNRIISIEEFRCEVQQIPYERESKKDLEPKVYSLNRGVNKKMANRPIRPHIQGPSELIIIKKYRTWWEKIIDFIKL